MPLPSAVVIAGQPMTPHARTDLRNSPLFVVFNPVSGPGDPEQLGPAVEAACAAAGRRCELLPVAQPSRLTETAREAVRRARAAGER